MLAHLQKLITLSLIVAGLGWLICFRHSSIWLAMGGFLLIALGYSGFLGLEFMLARAINKGEPIPQPSRTELLRAWLGETLTAPRVFFWRQPFRSSAIPDHIASPGSRGRRGVVFIHGFFCNRGLWNPWLRRIRDMDRAFAAVNLEPVLGSIDDYVPQIEAAVQQVSRATGLPPLLVCHSMGGLAVRAWLTRMKAEARVHHVVTIATPHCGTWLARFGRGHNSRQMRLQSDWQSQLDHEMPADRHALFTCWYSNCDNIVFPASSATLPGADNRLLSGLAHVQMAFAPQVVNATLALLDD